MACESLPKTDGVEYRIIGWAPDYAVGDDGSVWSKRVGKRWKKLKATTDHWGYSVVNIYLEKWKCRLCKVHELVLMTFVGPCPEGMECCHAPDPSKSNNARSNLRWGTRLENMLDKTKHGTQLHGESVPGVKLTVEQVVEMRELYATGTVTYQGLADKFGLTLISAYDIVRGKNWKRAPGPIARKKRITKVKQ